MKITSIRPKVLFLAALAGTLPLLTQAGTFTFAEYDGTPDDTVIPIATLPEGSPDGATTSWTGFVLNSTAGDTPMSVMPSGDRAVLAFLPPVIVSSINALDTTTGSAVTIIGSLHGIEVWRYTSPRRP